MELRPSVSAVLGPNRAQMEKFGVQKIHDAVKPSQRCWMGFCNRSESTKARAGL